MTWNISIVKAIKRSSFHKRNPTFRFSKRNICHLLPGNKVILLKTTSESSTILALPRKLFVIAEMIQISHNISFTKKKRESNFSFSSIIQKKTFKIRKCLKDVKQKMIDFESAIYQVLNSHFGFELRAFSMRNGSATCVCWGATASSCFLMPSKSSVSPWTAPREGERKTRTSSSNRGGRLFALLE